jgi:hypothetical protein
MLLAGVYTASTAAMRGLTESAAPLELATFRDARQAGLGTHHPLAENGTAGSSWFRLRICLNRA